MKCVEASTDHPQLTEKKSPLMVRERTDWAMEPQPKVTSRKVPAVSSLNTAARRGGRATVLTGTCSGHCYIYTLGQYSQDGGTALVSFQTRIVEYWRIEHKVFKNEDKSKFSNNQA